MPSPDQRLVDALPRPAATVVLARDEPRFEVLLTVRAKQLRFMGGAAVFPGGAVTAADADERWASASTLPPLTAAEMLGDHQNAAPLAPFVCALRETFEEVGLLLAKGGTTRIERAVADDAGGFLELCLRSGIMLDTAALTFAGRWVTPLGAPIRFDTMFFIAQPPPRWEPDPDASEVERCVWMEPQQALDALGAGELLMAPPTVEMLQRLAAHANVQDAVVALGTRGLDGPGRVLVAPLSPMVSVVLAPNPGPLTGPGTNTYVVGVDPAVVIDPAVSDPEYLDAILATAGAIEQVLVTHRHPDHVGGVEALVARTGAPVAAYGAMPVGGIDVMPVADGDTVEVSGVRLRALHTPGHSPDHLCFLMEGTATLFSGDNILGEGTAVIAPPEGDMAQYLASLERLSKLHIDRIYPGHFRSLDGGIAVIQGYIAHRRARERAILGAVSAAGSTLDDVVTTAYSDTSVELHPIARYSALAHLEKLEREGVLQRVEDLWLRRGVQ